ncbi:MAG: DUF3750 domain-containing protein [Pseudomonadota bacterium]
MLTVIAAAMVGLWLTSRFLQPTAVGPAVAPDPASTPEAVVQVYGADVWGFRGRFAIHTWIATKAPGASFYKTYQVIGWRLRRDGTALSVDTRPPDRDWFGSQPTLLHEVRGSDAAPLVDAIERAVESYPYAREYVMWPGPNSNSFTQWIGLEVPQLGLELPAKAIGKNWMVAEYPASR